MMIQQIEHKYSEEHIMESTTVNKKNTARTICAIIGGIIVLNLLWWIAILCVTILFSALTRMFPKPTFAP